MKTAEIKAYNIWGDLEKCNNRDEELVVLIKALKQQDKESRIDQDKITKQTCTEAIDNEPELPGAMPDNMWEAIKGDRDACQEAMRIIVTMTKSGIKDRMFNTKAV